MYFVYAIKSQIKNYIYVGLTNNLSRRLAEHNACKEQTTRPYAPYTLIHEKKFSTRPEARNYEKRLKSGSGKEYLKSLVS